MNSMPPVIAEYIEGLRTHDVEKIGGTVWDDMVFVSTARALGKQEFLHFLRCLYIAFPDWHYEHDPPEWREDEISIKWRQGGTHQAVFAMPGIAPVAATHRLVKLPEQFFFYRLRRDKIVEIRPEPIPGGAPSGILRQIGIEVPIL